MPSTLVHLGLGLAVGAVALRGRFDRWAVLVVAAAVAVPDLDAFVALVSASAHRSVLHTVLIPAGAGGLVYYDTRVRDASLLRERFGERGVALAWTWTLVYAVVGIGLDLVTVQGANLFYPVYDQFFEFTGEVYVSTAEGFVQTFVDVTIERGGGGGPDGVDVDAGQIGSTDEVIVDTGVNPVDDEPGPPNRRFPIVVRGWQLALLVASTALVVARRRLRPLLEAEA